MLTPDYHSTKLGSKDFVFQVNKWPFSITCNPALPTITECFIDLALVKDMRISMKKVECRNISYAGYATKLVGSISQSVQVVRDGVANGTMHLKAKVIRNLTNLYGVDCIASKKLYKQLADAASSAVDVSLSSEASEAANDVPTDDSADDVTYDVCDSPETFRRKRKNRFRVMNLPLPSSAESSPERNHTRKTSTSPTAQVQSSPSYLNSASQGPPAPEGGSGTPSHLTPAEALKTYLNPPVSPTKPIPPPKPKSQAPLQLQNLIFCGLKPPCPCVDKCRPPQLQILPPHYPVYLPTDQLPCGQDCGSHHAHGDNLHPPDSRLCPCDPPRLDPGSAFHCQVVSYDEPPLPPDFQPCGLHCAYEDCGCLRQYDGRDWMS